ncbi:variant erythrocyte surface antigen-1 family protein, partial [Babesia divergens]
DLQYSSPCGQDLWRVLDAFLQCCFNIFNPEQKFVEKKVKNFQKKCSTCKNATKSKQSPPSPCNCCKPGSYSDCEACKALFADSSLKSLFRQEYVSSYDPDKASWNSLCPKSGSQPCCGQPSCPPCSHSGSCPPGGCCPDCPQKKAAKIFLGMLPCLYYGLKIVHERCNPANSELWPKWSGKISTPSDLNNFLKACGYDLKILNDLQASQIYSSLSSLFNSGSTGSFDKIYDFVSKKYFSKTLPSSPCSSSCPSPSGSSSHVYPSTVRSILLWLSGLPFASGFNALLSHSKGLCPPSEKSLNSDEFLYCIHVSCFFVPVSVISAIQHPGASKSFLPSTSDWTSFCYPEDPFDLFNMFLENVRKVYIPLKFLEFQCERDKDSAGWKDCAFGRQCVKGLESSLSTSTPGSSCCKSSGPHGILCTSVPGESDVHEHCISSKPGVSCLGLTGKCEDSGDGQGPTDAHTSGKCKYPCPHPLQRFLTHGSESFPQSQSKDYPFALPGIVPMGFSKNYLPATARSGESLLGILDIFVGDSDSDQKVCFLRDLLRFLLCLTRTPPETLGELFSFYYKLAEWFNPDGQDPREALKKSFKDSLETEISSHPGAYGFGPKLTGAVQNLYESAEHKSGNHPAPPYSLKLLSHCWNSHPNCGNFLFPLATNAWDLFAPSNSDVYLSWICYLAKDFKGHFEKFQEEFSSSSNSCCSASSGSQCKILECPCILPKFYKNGFTFMLPSKLSGKNCSDFIAQLGNFVTKSTLDDLIEVVDAFLWSIRLPFFLFVLAFWAFVISYFLYVQLYKLDLLHLKSHAHFSRS